MERNRVRRYALGLAGVALIPPLLWIGMVLMAPTAWARRHVVGGDWKRTAGDRSRSAGLSVPFLGGVELTGLAFGSPKNTDDPWLKAEKLRLDISLCELFQGKVGPGSIEIDGGALRVLRRADGSLELADFILPPPRDESGRATAR